MGPLWFRILAVQMCERGRDACKQCLMAGNRTKVMATIREWCVRISFVDLTHCALKHSRSEQAAQANFMKEMFVELQHEPLATTEFKDLLTRSRNMFMPIGTNRQNEALQTFIQRSLKFLAPKMIVGVAPEVRGQVFDYVDALSDGRLLPHESSALDRVRQDVLRWNFQCSFKMF